MFNFLCKAFLHGRCTIKPSSTHKLLFARNPLSLISRKFISSTANHDSITVSYLINSCGLSPESALTASKVIRFKTPEKPESVIAFLKNHGFSETQVSDFVKKFPEVLGSDPEKTLLPKFEFFKSKGVSRPDLVNILCGNPSILHRSLENQLIPAFEVLNDVFKSDEKTFFTIKRYSRLLVHDLRTYVRPNIHILRDNGVPEPNIAAILRLFPGMFFTTPDKFRESVEEVKQKGFNPLMFTFVMAVRVLRAVSKLTWEKKIEVYKRWGWSEEVILMAFRRFPIVMALSEDKIMGMMDYYVNVLGLESSFVSERPELLSYSLKKRVLPRGSVALVLLSKGLVRASGLGGLFRSTEKSFLEKFVCRYQEEAPQLLKLYTEALDFSRQLKNE